MKGTGPLALPRHATGRCGLADFDTAGHVNNAVHWAVVEDELAGGRLAAGRAEVEYQRAIMPGCRPGW